MHYHTWLVQAKQKHPTNIFTNTEKKIFTWEKKKKEGKK